MADTIAVYYHEAVCGVLEMEKQGLYLRFCGQCTLRTQEVLRAYLRLDSGTLPLGVAIPQGDTLLISQTVLASKVISHQIVQAYLSPSGPQEYAPWQGKLLDYDCQGLRKVGKEGSTVAVPLDTGVPFALLPLICLFSYAEIEKKPYLTIQLDEQGAPVLPD